MRNIVPIFNESVPQVIAMQDGIQETQQITNLADLEDHTRHWTKDSIVQPIFLADASQRQDEISMDTSNYFGPCAGFVYEYKEGIWIFINVPNYDNKLDTVYFARDGQMMEFIAISYQPIEPNRFAKGGGTLLRTYKKREKDLYG